MSDPDDPGNYNGDNLAFDPEDDHDENTHLNWLDHPIRRLFDNPRASSHHSWLDDDGEDRIET